MTHLTSGLETTTKNAFLILIPILTQITFLAQEFSIPVHNIQSRMDNNFPIIQLSSILIFPQIFHKKFKAFLILQKTFSYFSIWINLHNNKNRLKFLYNPKGWAKKLLLCIVALTKGKRNQEWILILFIVCGSLAIIHYKKFLFMFMTFVISTHLGLQLFSQKSSFLFNFQLFYEILCVCVCVWYENEWMSIWLRVALFFNC